MDEKGSEVKHDLRFDEPTHTYTIWGDGYDGLVIPSITQVIQRNDMYGYPRNAGSIAKMNHGSKVHKHTEWYDKKAIDVADVYDVTPEILGYENFVRETSFVPELIEAKFHHRTYFYAGTIDRYGLLTIGGEQYRALVEIKTGSYHPAVNIQMAAQRELLEPVGHRVDKAFAIYLATNGTYQLKEATAHPQNWSIFLGALGVLRWKEINKIGKKS